MIPFNKVNKTYSETLNGLVDEVGVSDLVAVPVDGRRDLENNIVRNIEYKSPARPLSQLERGLSQHV